MCCEPQGSSLKEVGECPECGGPVDEEGYTMEKCGYSSVVCQVCENAPCDQAC